MTHEICVTPAGLLKLVQAACQDTDREPNSSIPKRLIEEFGESTFAGLTFLASHGCSGHLSAALGFWRQFGRQYFTAVCRQYSQPTTTWQSISPPDVPTLAEILGTAPPMPGLEYVSIESLRMLWHGLDDFTKSKVSLLHHDLTGYLRSLDPAWNLVGRVTFHLAENKKNPEFPFALLVTYTDDLHQSGSPQHTPLATALKLSIEQKDPDRLDALIEPVTRAAKTCSLVAQLLDSRALFSPQALTIRQAFDFLSSVPQMEAAGLIVRVPNWWNASKPPRPQVSVRIGSQSSTALNLDLTVEAAIDGQPLNADELAQLMAAREGMTLLRGKWVQVDPLQLQSALQHWKTLQKEHRGGLDFLQGMRLLAGANLEDSATDSDVTSWSRIEAGPWFAETLNRLRDPSGIVNISPGPSLKAQLRPYQLEGVRWLWFANQLGLGVCLADDMGLGKTIQVLALLLQIKERQEGKAQNVRTSGSQKRGSTVWGSGNARGKLTGKGTVHTHASPGPSLLIVPTSLLGNWQREVSRFAPDLRLFIAHGSCTDADTLKRVSADPSAELACYDLVATTYGLARTATWLSNTQWRLVILDEAQAIKNSGSAQSKAIKKIPSLGRIILTGTPVENHLGDLWSLFDFCAPGLLGSAKEFQKFAASNDEPERSRRLTAIRKLIRPYFLRRLKTDPHVVPDLPDKIETRVDCGLTPTQAALYQQITAELTCSLDDASGIQRRGMVLAAIMQLKQICNHPALYLKQAQFPHQSSGKFTELQALCDLIVEKQEKVLVFTQFQSMCEPLQQFLRQVFGCDGLLLTGKTPAAKRGKLVAAFQNDLGPPFFVISVKAGGTGLNLTQACRVVHFDRWWNPAVEDQATDRAFRIGQKRNVLVHKFVCRGTLEERIDELIQSKKKLSQELFTQDGELNLTEMSNDQLMQFVSLDLTKATTT